MSYQAVIGLEVHVQLSTRSKMFSGVASGYGASPNTLTDPVVLALPGALPVLNKEALDKTILVGLMFGCEIASLCKWDRKNYWYPDSPKNYQISQYDQPICRGGSVEIEMPGPSRNLMGPHRNVLLTRIHLEEDVGKLTHFEHDSLVDLNRAGTPLIEIVSEPDLYSGEECFAYLTAIRTALVAAGISDCDMEKGQMRCDANISVRPVGDSSLGTKVELKNLNTISGVRQGVDFEIRRQVRLCEEGKRAQIVQETRRWNAELACTTPLRSKEQSHDYRYFPDPDLLPLRIDAAWKEALRQGLPEMPFERQRRYQDQFDLPYSVTSVLCPDRPLAEFFEQAVALGANPRTAANWITNDLLRELGAAGSEGPLPLSQCPLTPRHIHSLVGLLEEGVLSTTMARTVFSEMFRSGKLAEEVVEESGLRQNSDSGEIERLCAAAMQANPKAVEQFKAGQEKAINALKGPVMKETRGKVNPQVLDATLRRLLQ